VLKTTSKQSNGFGRYSNRPAPRARIGLNTDPGPSIPALGGVEVCLANSDHMLNRVSVRAYKMNSSGQPIEVIKIHGVPVACCQCKECIGRTRQKLAGQYGEVFMGHPTTVELTFLKNAAAASAPTLQPAPTPGSRTLSSRPTTS
jgi:hypothetical protein